MCEIEIAFKNIGFVVSRWGGVENVRNKWNYVTSPKLNNLVFNLKLCDYRDSAGPFTCKNGKIKFHWFPLPFTLCQKVQRVVMRGSRKKREFPLQFPSPSSGSTIAESKFIQVYMRRAQCELKAIYFSWFSNSILIVSRFVGKIFFLNCTEITTTMQRFFGAMQCTSLLHRLRFSPNQQCRKHKWKFCSRWY